MDVSSEVSSRMVGSSNLSADAMSNSAPSQVSLPRNNLTHVDTAQEHCVEHTQPKTGQASPSTASETSDHDFDAERLALFSNVAREINRENKDGSLEWVFDIGWSNRFITEIVPSETPLRLMSAMIMSAKEKHAISLLEFLFDTLADAVRRHGMF